ncbi:MAG TPA: hypothetical protein VMJ70_07275 [Candidatus Sulfotelmatobacter sp.]|nr:hypothetical protein [Candidatus Sulfotelmatobacter sp.]
MNRSARRGAQAAMLAMLGVLAARPMACAAANAPIPASARALAAKLGGGHRAEADVAYALPDPLGGPARSIRGRLALESPDRVRLDFATTGESVTLRADGGEWLQPANRQLVRIPADRALAVLSWGRTLLPTSGASFREDSLAPRRFRLTPLAAEAQGMEVLVELDAHGLPRQLTVLAPDSSRTAYHLSNWRFVAARGRTAYALSAPPGFDVVDLP